MTRSLAGLEDQVYQQKDVEHVYKCNCCSEQFITPCEICYNWHTWTTWSSNPKAEKFREIFSLPRMPCIIHQDETQPLDELMRKIIDLGFIKATFEKTSLGGWRVKFLGERYGMLGCICSFDGNGEVYKQCSRCGLIECRLEKAKEGYPNAVFEDCGQYGFSMYRCISDGEKEN